jgi:AcrR family transcriptional regulator
MTVPATSRVLQLALDPEFATEQDALSERILDAALALAAASGLKNLTMDDVAAKAGVGRMTVYRRFSRREVMIEALGVRECRRALQRMAAAIDLEEPVDARLARLFAVTIELVRTHPLLARLARVEPESFLAVVTRDDSAVLKMVTAFLVQLTLENQASGMLVGIEPEVLVELGIRLGVSLVLMPDTAIVADGEDATFEAVRDLLRRFLIAP